MRMTSRRRQGGVGLEEGGFCYFYFIRFCFVEHERVRE
jgi:hypothetical protein